MTPTQGEPMLCFGGPVHRKVLPYSGQVVVVPTLTTPDWTLPAQPRMVCAQVLYRVRRFAYHDPRRCRWPFTAHPADAECTWDLFAYLTYRFPTAEVEYQLNWLATVIDHAPTLGWAGP